MSDEETKEESGELTEASDAAVESSEVPEGGGAPSGEEQKPKDNQNQEENEDLADALDEEVDEGAGAAAEVSMDDVDQAIGEEDPLFQDELSKIKPEDFENLVISNDQVSGDVDDRSKGPGFWTTFFKNLPRTSKMQLYLAIAVVLLFVPVIILLFHGSLLPTFDIPYAISMSEFSDEYYSYPTDEMEVPLFDDYRSNTVTFNLPKLTINLKSEGGSPSYGEFKFFLNLREKELSGVISARQSEVLDLIQRTLEQVTWEELQTPVGKEKVKKVIRYRVNDYLQGNIVLGVFYQSIILQK